MDDFNHVKSVYDKQCETEVKSVLFNACFNNADLSTLKKVVSTGKTITANVDDWAIGVYETTNTLGTKVLLHCFDVINSRIIVDNDFVNTFGSGPLDYYFCRVSLPDTKLIKTERNKPWGLLKQRVQYKYFRAQLLKWELSSTVYRGYVHFEQFKTGNIHFHMIVAIPLGIHINNLRAELSDLFGINSKKETQNFFNSRVIPTKDDLKKVIEYLLNKQPPKDYEVIDQNIFKPLRIKCLLNPSAPSSPTTTEHEVAMRM